MTVSAKESARSGTSLNLNKITEMKDQNNLVLTRTFDAPRETIFNAWIDPLLIERWWGPNGVTNEVDMWDARPEGKLDLTMLAGKDLGPLAGQKWPMTGMFEKVTKPDEIVFTSNAIMNGKEILRNRNSVKFEENDGKTKMTVTINVIKKTPEAEGALKGMEMGWNQQLDKLVKLIKN